MKYKLTVVGLTENPNYTAQLQKYEERTRYTYDHNNAQHPPTHVESRTLEIELREKEYQAVREAVLATFGVGE